MRKVQYTVEELTCPECSFVAVNANGLRGHRQFKHGVRPSGAQLPLQKQDLLVSESKLGQLLDERLSVISEQLDALAGVVDELQQSFPGLVAQLNQRSSIADFPMPEQYDYLLSALHSLDAEAATMLLVRAGKVDMLLPATDEEVKKVEDQQAKEVEEHKVGDLAEAIKIGAKARKRKESEEPNPHIRTGRVDEPGWKHFPLLDLSIRKD